MVQQLIDRETNQEAFPTLNDDNFAELSQFGKSQTFADGETLIKAGEKEFDFYLIESGKVEIIDSSSGEERIITTSGEREFIGDLANLKGSPANCSVIAKGECQVVAIAPDRLREILNKNSHLSDLILQTFIARREALEESDFVGLRVIGPKGCSDTFRIRDFLAKNHVKFNWIDTESDAEVDEILQHFEIGHGDTPVIAYGNEWLDKNPKNEKLAIELGLKKPIENKLYDLTVIGAGPAGLAAAVYGSSEGLDTIILEKEALGGQAGCSSKIENYTGFPLGLSGRELACRANIQAQKFGSQFCLTSEVLDLEANDDGYLLKLNNDEQVKTQSVLIATGVTYRKLPVEGIENYEGTGIYYSATKVEAQLCQSATVIIVGGGNSAGQAAVFLSQFADKVLILIRKDNLAQKMSSYLLNRVEKIDNVEILTHTEVTGVKGDLASSEALRDRILTHAEITNNQTKEKQEIEVCGIFIFIGAKPHTDWLPEQIETDEKGYIKTGLDVKDSPHWKADRQPFFLETSFRGIFAAGDVRSDSIKRVASAVGEGSMAVKFVHKVLKE
jgi:thioredoxin reductase (NADPH)